MLDHKMVLLKVKTKRIYEVTARLYETVGVEVGPDLNNMEKNTIQKLLPILWIKVFHHSQEINK
jgi:hypothetical protein